MENKPEISRELHEHLAGVNLLLSGDFISFVDIDLYATRYGIDDYWLFVQIVRACERELKKLQADETKANMAVAKKSSPARLKRR